MYISLRFLGFLSRCAPRVGVATIVLASLPDAAFPLTDFRRADSNSDDKVDISDALHTLGFLFLGGLEPVCDDAADANDDGSIDISDALYTLGYLFLGTRGPPAPGPDATGPDPTPDKLACGIELRCDSPADGALVDLVSGAGVSIRGTALGLFDVRVNGAPVAVADDWTFSATVDGRYGLNFVELSATDGRGATHTALCAFLGAERWLTEGDQLDEALLYRFERSGFTKLSSLLPPWFNANLSERLDSSLLAANPIFEGNCGALGTCVTEMRYLSLSATPTPVVNILVVNQNTLNVRIQLDLRLRLRVRCKLLGITLPAIEGEVLFSNVIADVEVSLGVDAATGRPLAAGQSINSVDTSAVSVQFPGLEPHCIGTVVSVAQDSVQNRLGSEALGGSAGLFEGLFAGMDVTLPAAGFPVSRLDGTGSVTVALEPRWGVALRDNGLTVLTGLRVMAPPPPPAATGRVPLPLAADLVGGPVRPGTDVWSAAHVGVFNQVLQVLWRAGLFDGTVDGAAMGPGLPEGTSLSVLLRTMPVVTGFDPTGMTDLDVGALDLVITHPDLPPGLRVIAGARVRARASLLSDDIVFDDIVTDELRISTGGVALDAASRATLQGLLERLLVKLAGIALNDSLPVLPATVITIPSPLGAYGLPVGSRLGGTPRLVIETNHVFLEGNIGLGP